MTTPNTLNDIITQAINTVEGSAISDTQVATMSLFYCLYRLGGYPYGDNHEGLARWTSEMINGYRRLCEGEDPNQ